MRETLRQKRGTKTHESWMERAAYSKEQAIVYVLLLVGLILLFFIPLLGSLIIGMVVGYYFASEIIYYLRNLDKLGAGREQRLRYIILATLVLAIFIAAPGFFIGAVVVAAFRQVLRG